MASQKRVRFAFKVMTKKVRIECEANLMKVIDPVVISPRNTLGNILSKIIIGERNAYKIIQQN